MTRKKPEAGVAGPAPRAPRPGAGPAKRFPAEATEPRLVLIDGNSLLYRSYYAIRRLSNSKGFPTNAIYGFLATLRKIRAECQPAYLAVVFDVKGPTIRHEAFKDYKAQRKPMPEDLVPQVPVLKEVLRALRIPSLELEKYEADDVLATLARRAAERNLETLVVTTDKDLLQIVGPKTSIYNPSKEIVIDAGGVKDFFGVEASQVVDVLALWGDPTDNVPGVPGIGEKTAKALIRDHGSLDKLLADLPRLGNPRLREKIEANRPLLDLSRRLVTVECGLDVPFDLDVLAVREPDAGEAARLFRELEFTTLLQEIVPASQPEARRYEAIFAEDALAALAERIKRAGRVSFDTETDSVFPTRARLVGMSFSLEPGEAYYLPLRHDYLDAPRQIPVERALDILRGVLENPRILKTGQNIKYDAIVLRREGLELRGIERDAMVLSYLLEPNWGKHNLERLAMVYLQTAKVPFEEVAGRGKCQTTMDRVAIERATVYACADADLAGDLGALLWDKVVERKLDRLYSEIERPLIGVLAEMERWGVRVDPAVLGDLSTRFERELGGLQGKIHELAGGAFNINSPRQLSEILFHKLGLRSPRKTRLTGSLSTSMEVLEELAPLHPLAELVLRFRQLAKLKSTYADALPALINPETGRIHTSYNQTVAATGRLSSSDPNLQNIPARGDWGPEFRKAFIADPGCGLLAADYSQIELRLLAHLSKDPALIETFTAGRDVHAETARRVFGEGSTLFPEEQRRRAKVVNFSIVYGTSAFSLAKELGTSTGDAQRFIDRYFEEYPGVKAYLEKSVEEAKDRGVSETLFGRQRQVPELHAPDRPTREAGRRIALNTPIQGAAADVIKIAMIRILEDFRRLRLQSKLILQVHDELVIEAPRAERGAVEEVVRGRMEGVCDLLVPLRVHLGWGENWAEAK